MPATQRGSVRKLPSGKHQLRYYDNDGERQIRRRLRDPTPTRGSTTAT